MYYADLKQWHYLPKKYPKPPKNSVDVKIPDFSGHEMTISLT